MTKLNKLSGIGIVALAACALMLPTSARAASQVPLPMYLNGSGILLITSMDPETFTGTWSGSESGQATHLGLYSLEESGTFYATETGSVWIGQGTLTAADCDQLKFDVTITCDGTGETGVMTFTGGTGRFDGASGSVNLVSVTDQVTGVYTISGKGTISY